MSPAQPRVRGNDWPALPDAAAAGPRPAPSLSLVVTEPSPGLPLPTHPDDLVEVVRSPTDATGDVLLWPVPGTDVSAHLRIHALAGYAVALDRPADRVRRGFRAYRAFRLQGASMRRTLWDATGGPDPRAGAAADLELGFRLAQSGALFVPTDPAAQPADTEDPVTPQTRAFLTETVSDLRRLRKRVEPRPGLRPYLAAEVATGDGAVAGLPHTIDGLLGGSVRDLTCRVVTAGADRPGRSADDPRVSFGDTPGWDPAATFQVRLPAGWAPAEDTLERLTEEMNRRGHGLRCVLLPDGQVVRLERTASFARARLLAAPDEPLDDVVDAVSGIWWNEGAEEGFTSSGG